MAGLRLDQAASRCCLGSAATPFTGCCHSLPCLAAAARMNADASACSLLEELDSRQDQVLDELDRLNGRIEQVIAEVLAWRGAEAVV
jgi:hypothetical protein